MTGPADGNGVSTSTFVNTCIAIPQSSRIAINAALANANGAVTVQPTSEAIDQLAAELNETIATQLNGAPVNMVGTAVPGGGC